MSLRPPEDLRDNVPLLSVWEALGRPRGYLAGGFLRDHLLGRDSIDLDISLSGSADDVAQPAQRLAHSLGTTAHLLGNPPRCVWRVDSPDLKIELWPLGSLSLDDDILRRDFTCNALAWELPNGPLIDRVGGLDDLRNGRLTAVARGNLQDDPVRLLRAPRFTAELDGFRIDHRTSQWIRELAPRLSYAPRARVGQELIRTLRAPRAERGILSIMELGLLRFAAPPDSALDTGWLHENASACDRLSAPPHHPIPAALEEGGDGARLVPLLMAWGTPPDAAIADYGWLRHHRRNAVHAAALVARAAAVVDAGPADRRELIHTAGGAFPSLLAAAAAIHDPDASSLDRWRRWWTQWTRNGSQLVRPAALLAAGEVAEIVGCGMGPGLSTAISALTTAQVRGDVRTSRGARRWLEQHFSSRHQG